MTTHSSGSVTVVYGESTQTDASGNYTIAGITTALAVQAQLAQRPQNGVLFASAYLGGNAANEIVVTLWQVRGDGTPAPANVPAGGVKISIIVWGT